MVSRRRGGQGHSPGARGVALLTGLAFLIAVTGGCASLEQSVKENPSTAVGAIVGTAGGMLIGGLLFKSAAGILLGGLVGGLSGGLIGHALERKEKPAEATNQQYKYTASQGTRVKIESVRTEPAQAKPGEQVSLIVTYALLTPNPNETVNVSERREITYQGSLVGNPALDVKRTGGTWTSALPLTLPANAEAGTYRLLTTVQAGSGQDTREASFTVRR